MYKEIILSERSTSLRRNNSEKLDLIINKDLLNNIFLINGNSFKSEKIKRNDLLVEPYDYYMIINIIQAMFGCLFPIVFSIISNDL